MQQCGACGLIFANPLPVPARLEGHYDVPPEEYWCDPADTASGPEHFRGQMETFAGLFRSDVRGAVALDVGAGTGRTMAALERAGFDAFGVEPSPSFHAAALEGGIAPGRLALSSVEEAEYEAASFDLVSFNAVLEHLVEPGQSLERALGWLKPGGFIHVEVPSSRWLMARLVDAAYRMQGLDYTCHLSPLHPPYHLFEFTLLSFEDHGRRHGYEVAHHVVHVAETYAPRAISRALSAVMARTGSGMQLEVWLRRA